MEEPGVGSGEAPTTTIGTPGGDRRASRELSAVEPDDFTTPIPRHHFPVGVVAGSLALVLCTGTHLQRVSAVLGMSWSWWGPGGSVGTYWSVRLWLMRLGLYQLQTAPEPADDWMWIVDHTMQLGERKCLIIVGIRQSSWNFEDRKLSHQDVQLIDLQPVTTSTGEVVYQQLEAATAKTGVPRAIMSDDGRDLHKGIGLFLEAHSQTNWLYDIKHKTACLLKHKLDKDDLWQAFIGEVNQFKQRVSVTSLACLLPPHQRGKARYLNIDVLVNWAKKMLALLDRPDLMAAAGVDATLVAAKLGWLRKYAEPIQGWQETMEVIECTETYVRHHGIHRGAEVELEAAMPNPQSATGQEFKEQLLAFVRDEVGTVRGDERLLGSSEVLESIIGKYKTIAGERGQHGMTGMILSLAAIVGRVTIDTVQSAMQTVSNHDLRRWCQEHLGTTVQGHRQKITATLKTEQKRQMISTAIT